MAYSKQVVERFEDVLKNPEKHAVGRFDPKDPMVATGLAGAPACGDVMKLDLKLNDDDKIIDVKFKTYVCGSAIASSTMFVEMLKGKTLELLLGYSHPINYDIPENITVTVDKQNNIEIKGPDKQLVGQTAAEIRNFRGPEPYKGKGIKYADEYINRKEGKKK